MTTPSTQRFTRNNNRNPCANRAWTGLGAL